MGLPKLQTPTYELVLPSTNEKIKFRPFLVKEQKILLMAQESGKDEDIASAIGNLVESCTFGKIDPMKSPLFDIEFIFLQIRAKSVGETAQLVITCPDDEKTTVPIKLNIESVSVQMTASHTNEIKISDGIKLLFRYPILSDMKGLMVKQDNEVEMVFKILSKCIHEIHHGEKIYNRVDITDDEINEFIDSMSAKQLDMIVEFFDTMPKLRHAIKVTNPNTKVKSEVVLEGLSNFLG